MKASAITICFAAALVTVVVADMCHHDCYNVNPQQGETAKQQLLQSGGVTDYKFSTATSNGGLQGVYGQAPPAGCQLAVCGHYPSQDAINAYRTAEHNKPQYQVLNGTGVGRYDATCTSCSS